MISPNFCLFDQSLFEKFRARRQADDHIVKRGQNVVSQSGNIFVASHPISNIFEKMRRSLFLDDGRDDGI